MPLRALYAREIGASSVEIGLMTSAFLLTGFLAAPPIGWLSDRLGHRNIMLFGLLMHAALVLLYIPVRSAEGLILLRALEGIAVIGILPPARALMNELAPRSRQGEALGLVSAARTVGIFLGPSVGTLLASGLGYTLSFAAAGLALALSAVMVLILPEKRSRRQAATLPSRNGWAGAFKGPLLLVYGLGLSFAIPQGVAMAVWSLYMQDRGASLPLIGLSFTAFALPAILAAPLTGRLSDRHGRYGFVILGISLSALIYGAYSFPLRPLWIIILSLGEGMAAAVARSALDGLLADVVPKDLKGRVQANFSAAGTAGSFLGATAAGFLYTLKPGMPFLSESVLYLSLVATLLLSGLRRLFPTVSSRTE
jgi:MFS family permease